MPPLTAPIASQDTATGQAHAAFCPICRGTLEDLRGLSRCSRCQFILCQACDGEQVEYLDAEFAED